MGNFFFPMGSNGFSWSEAHNEPVKNMLVMIYDERDAAARDGVEIILKLQKNGIARRVKEITWISLQQ